MISGTMAAAIATRGSAKERPATGTSAKGRMPAATNGAIRQTTLRSVEEAARLDVEADHPRPAAIALAIRNSGWSVAHS